MKGIADTGFIVAFARGHDQHHVWAVDIAKQITEPLLTSEPVLAEAAFQLESSSYVLALLQDEMLRLAFDCNRNIAPLAELARRYRDRNPDLADLCLIRMSELYPRHVVITVDSDFRVYRRNRREAIPIHLPPHALLRQLNGDRPAGSTRASSAECGTRHWRSLNSAQQLRIGKFSAAAIH